MAYGQRLFLPAAETVLVDDDLVVSAAKQNAADGAAGGAGIGTASGSTFVEDDGFVARQLGRAALSFEQGNVDRARNVGGAEVVGRADVHEHGAAVEQLLGFRGVDHRRFRSPGGVFGAIGGVAGDVEEGIGGGADNGVAKRR